MIRTRTVFRVAGWLAIGLCGTVIVAALLIHLDQFLLRRRAERLLADIRSLELRKSTYADARIVIDRWNRDVWQEKPCQPDACDVEIGLGDFFRRNIRFFGSHPHLLSLGQRLGGRLAYIHASISVQNYVVWHKSVTAYVETNEIGRNESFTLIGETKSSTRTFSLLHPEFRLGAFSGCTGCAHTYVVFTPYANPADVFRLMDFDFSCLTRLISCKTVEDLLPGVRRQIQADRLEYKKQSRHCGPEAVRTLGRLCKRVVVGRVSKLETYPDAKPATVQFEKDLKSGDFRLAPHAYRIHDVGSSVYRIGERYVLFFPYINAGHAFEECPMVAATEANLEAAKQGIEDDVSDHQ